MSCLPQRGGNGRILTGAFAALPDIFDLSVGGQVRWGSVAPMLEPRALSIAAIGRQQACEPALRGGKVFGIRSEEHTSELQSLMRISYAVLRLKKKQKKTNTM